MVATPRPLLVVLTSLALAACTSTTVPGGGDPADIAHETSITASPSPTPRTVQQVIQDTRPYVVRIESEACDPTESGLGSGYLLDGRHVVTVAN
jgi:predicted small secreted protein